MRTNIIVLAAFGIAFAAEGQSVPPMQNAPFSAETIQTHAQALADGTHITSPETIIKLYRDSLGRTRSENYGPSPESSQLQPSPQSIMIDDPIDGARYFLSPNNKTARKFSVPKRPAAASVPPVPPQIVAAPSGAMILGAPAIQIYSASGPIPFSAPFGAGRPTAAPQSKNEKLGTQTIEGLIAEGQRFTTTWAVGSMGNDRELVTTNESWRSTELGIVVLSKNSDPRSGDSTTKLTNISRAEPDASLFKVPPDYTIEEQSPPVRLQSTAPAPAAK